LEPRGKSTLGSAAAPAPGRVPVLSGCGTPPWRGVEAPAVAVTPHSCEFLAQSKPSSHGYLKQSSSDTRVVVLVADALSGTEAFHG
jgi:hypothetical protein